jgi:magnesium transporter
VVLLPADTRALDALERLRSATAPHPLVFVADGERRLAGLVGLAALLQAPAAATLATLMQRPVALLAAVAPLAATPAHPGWSQSSILPVVESGDRLVGVMTRDALQRALHQATLPGRTQEHKLPALLALSYWQSLTGLLQAGMALLPTVPALADRRDGEH